MYGADSSGRVTGDYDYAVVVPVRVVDGDTLWVRSLYGFKAGQRFKIRLADIDAPELSTAAGKISREEMNRIASHYGCFVIVVDVHHPYDKYGRVVAVLLAPDVNGFRNVNYCLANGGFAEFVDYFNAFHPEDFSEYWDVPDYVARVALALCSTAGAPSAYALNTSSDH